MRLERIIPTSFTREIVEERARQYLLACGYMQVGSETQLHFRRGSVLKTLTSLSPEGWRADVRIVMMPAGGSDKTRIIFRIRSSMQLVTKREKAFWRQEIQGLEKSLSSGNVQMPARDLAEDARRQNARFTAILMALLAVVGIPLFVGLRIVSTADPQLGNMLSLFLATAVAVIAVKVVARSRRSLRSLWIEEDTASKPGDGQPN